VKNITPCKINGNRFISHSANQNLVPLALKSADPLHNQITDSSNQIKISAAKRGDVILRGYPRATHLTLQ